MEVLPKSNVPKESEPSLKSSIRNAKQLKKLEIALELENGGQETIQVNSKDNSRLIARQLAEKHSLSIEFEDSLANFIQKEQQKLPKKTAFCRSTGSLGLNSPNEESDKTTRDGVSPKYPYKVKKATPRKDPNNPDTCTKKTPKNFGEWLYMKGSTMKEATNEKIQSEKENQSQEKWFKPQINKKSRSIALKSLDSPEDLLLGYGYLYRDHKELLKKEAEDQEKTTCTFQPNPSKKRTKRKSLHEDLYKDAQTRKLKLTNSQNNFYKPMTSRKSSLSKEELFERLFSSKTKTEEEMAKKRQEKEEAELRECTLKPSVSSQSSIRNSEVWEHLYNLRNQKEEKIKKISEKQEVEILSQASTQKASKNSLKIVENFRKKQLKRLFKALDSSGEGTVCSKSICKNSLDSESIRILKPFFELLENSGTALNFKEFCEVTECLMAELTVAEKNYLLKKDPPKKETTFKKPSLSSNSKKLALKRRNNLPKDFYERLQQEKKLSQIKLEMKRETFQETYSFQPSTKKSLK